MRASLTRLTNRIKEMEGKIDQPTTFGLAKRNKDKLESFDSKFKVHHYAIVGILDRRGPRQGARSTGWARRRHRWTCHTYIQK